MAADIGRIEKLLEFAPKGEADNFCRKGLKKSLLDYQKTLKSKNFLADVRYGINGKEYDSLFDAIHEVETLEEVSITFQNPQLSRRWEYDTPTHKIKVNSVGRGGLVLFPIDPKKLNKWDMKQSAEIVPAMFRGYTSHFHSPESIKTHSQKIDDEPVIVPPLLALPHQMWSGIRKSGVIPLGIVICAYSKEHRYSYNIDLIQNKLLKDFRDGRIPIANRIPRSPLQYFELDKILSSQKLPPLPKKLLQIFFESKNATPADVGVGLGITEKMAENNVRALVNRGFIIQIGKPPNVYYEVNMKAMGVNGKD